MSEADIQAKVRLEAASKGARLWRNNVGCLRCPDGSYLRYGLANDSSAVNDVFKSSDLIGIKPILITQDMVGSTIGQFIAREVKRPDWVYKATGHEKAQKAFIDFINSMGGDASFCTNTGTI